MKKFLIVLLTIVVVLMAFAGLITFEGMLIWGITNLYLYGIGYAMTFPLLRGIAFAGMFNSLIVVVKILTRGVR